MISLPVLLCLYFVNVDIHALNGNARAFFHDVLHLVDDALHHSAYIHAVKHRYVEVYHQLVTPCADAYAALVAFLLYEGQRRKNRQLLAEDIHKNNAEAAGHGASYERCEVILRNGYRTDIVLNLDHSTSLSVMETPSRTHPLTAVKQPGNSPDARYAIASLSTTPNTAEPLPVSIAPLAPSSVSRAQISSMRRSEYSFWNTLYISGA